MHVSIIGTQHASHDDDPQYHHHSTTSNGDTRHIFGRYEHRDGTTTWIVCTAHGDRYEPARAFSDSDDARREYDRRAGRYPSA